MTRDEIAPIYSTADFPTICSLFYLNFEPKDFGRDSTHPTKTIVRFKRNRGLDVALKQLHSRQLLVEPLAFLEITRQIKSRLRDQV